MIIYLLILFIAFVGCNQNAENIDEEMTTEKGSRKIEVVEHMDGGGYTFIKGNENGEEIWLAVRW